METLREKLGPLPVYAWLILLTAAGLAWWLISGRKKQAKDQPQAAGSDVPQTVIQTPVSIVEQEGDEDRDREKHRKKKATKHKCPAGYHFEPVPLGSMIWPAGGKQVPGGFCVPDRRKTAEATMQPVVSNPRVPPAGAAPTNHEPQAA